MPVIYVQKILPLPTEEERNPDFLPFTPEVLALLGDRVVEYETIAVAPMAEGTVSAVLADLEEAGHLAWVDRTRTIAGEGHDFDPLDPSTRRGPWAESPQESVPLAGLAWIQFAYPIRPEWYEALAACDMELMHPAAHRTLMVAVASLGEAGECESILPYLTLVEPVLSTDRAEPAVLEHEGPLEVVLAPGVVPSDLWGSLPGATAIEDRTRDGELGIAWVRGDSSVAAALVDESRVLRVIAVSDESGPSDERQALILARQFQSATDPNGAPIEPSSASSGTYQNWLAERDLYGVGGAQATIAFFDTGIDDGVPTGTAFHSDFAGRVGESLNKALNITVEPEQPGFGVAVEDRTGHGTMVIGTAIGAGVAAGRPGTFGLPFPGQPDWFAQGQGVAPEAKGLAIKRWAQNTNCSVVNLGNDEALANMEDGHNWAWGEDATIANHSWNGNTSNYSELAGRFDRIALDASTDEALQPVTLVVSAGNRGNAVTCTLKEPATAKNVIAVGSVDSWYDVGTAACNSPAADVPGAPLGPFVPSNGFQCYAGGISDIANGRLTMTVAAPGWRVDGPRRADQPCSPGLCGQTGIPAAPRYSWSYGTSVAAPAVAGAVALKTKQFLDGAWGAYGPNGLPPRPELLKAAIVATAQSLGPKSPTTGLVSPCWADDCRPSRYSGWGVLDLDRLTDPETPFVAINGGQLFTAAGQSWSSQPLEVDDPSKEVLIALVWNDLRGIALDANLKRDLDLKVQLGDARVSNFWAGNNFAENPPVGVTPDDNGYSRLVTSSNVKLDHFNVVEAVFLPPGALQYDQIFRIFVSSFEHTFDPVFSDQAFGLYAWNVKCDDSWILPLCGNTQ